MDDSLRLMARTARAGIESGALRGDALLQRLLSVPLCDRDVWVDQLLGIEEPPPDIPDLPRGAVPYLPCGVEEILAMVLEAPVRPDDELVDLGSGLGRVVILAHLLSGARASGVELQEPLVRGARARCAALGLAAVSFVHADAAEVALEFPDVAWLLARRTSTVALTLYDSRVCGVPNRSAREAASPSPSPMDPGPTRG
jgi:SAM-dependent methyltransferase